MTAPVCMAVVDGTSMPVADLAVSAGHAPFRWVLDATIGAAGDGQTITDPVCFLGWNVGPGGARVNPDRPALHLSFEADYWTNIGLDPGWHHQSEFHIQHQGLDNTVRRVFTSSVPWTGPAANKVETALVGDSFNIAKSDGRTIIGWPASANSMTVGMNMTLDFPDAGIAVGNGTGTAVLYLNSGNAGRLRWQVSGVNKWQIDTAGGRLRVVDDANGSRPVLTFEPGASAITARVAVGAVLKFSDGALFQRNVPDPAAGPARYLRIIDSSGAVLAVPCYQAA